MLSNIKPTSYYKDIYEITSEYGNEIEANVELEETLYYLQNWKIYSEVVNHTITIMYDEENSPVVVADSYSEEYSGYISASYVNPDAVFLADESGSDECIATIAATQVGYLEKASNSQLDSFTANAGNNNYTKYGKWYGKNGVAWCAIFVSWCANQANVSTSVIKKTASCDSSMNFFKNQGLFHASKYYGGNYTPKVGDIFFLGTSTTNATHTGIVVGVNSTHITIIHGNSTSSGQDQVRKSTLNMSDTSLLGYGTPNYENDDHCVVDWSWNESEHWGNCDVCGAAVSPVVHTFEEKMDATGHWNECAECGYCETTLQHTYIWKYSTTSHWRECTECGYKTLSISHNWTNMGSYSKCSICGARSDQLNSTLSLRETVAP